MATIMTHHEDGPHHGALTEPVERIREVRDESGFQGQECKVSLVERGERSHEPEEQGDDEEVEEEIEEGERK
jgi:hypothetical protein